MKYEMFISSIVTYYAKNNLIEKRQIDVFKYGASLTFASIISFAIAFAWGAVFHCILEVSMFLVLFIPLRIFTGGYHAPSFSRCIGSFIGMLVALTISINYFPDMIVRPITLLCSVILIFTVYLYSPVQHSNASISKENMPIFRKISLIICIVEVIIIVGFSCIPSFMKNYRSLIIAATFSLIIGSFLIYLAKATSINKGE